jgi:PAS domain-containing protein
MIDLIVVKGPSGEGATFSLQIGQNYTIGRSSECDIKLQATGVSKQHCSLTPVSGLRVEVEDLGSANGTYVNGLLVKKHVMKPGDTLNISQFILQLRKQSPQLVVASAPVQGSRVFNLGGGGFSGPAGMTNIGAFPKGSPAPAPQEAQPNFAFAWFEKNIFPIADNLLRKSNLVVLLFGSILFFACAVSILSVNPFKDRANYRVQSQSIEVAKLYARQIARINLDAIIDQRYNNLVVNLDVRKGQTPGIVEAMILDRVNAQILAPPEKLGQALPADNTAAAIAIAKDVEYVGIDENSNTAFVSVPIIVGTPDGNKAVASAFVRFNYLQNQFNFSSVIDQVLNSILLSLTFGWFLFALLYRWTEGTLQRAADAIQKALRSNETSIELEVKSRGAENLVAEIGFALSKAGNSGGSAPQGDQGGAGSDWAISAVNNTAGAAAALDGRLTILAWNPRMAQILGIQESVAVGAEISQASRDVAFESAVRDLAQEAVTLPWRNTSRQIDLGGRPHIISLVWGGFAFLVNVDATGGDR